MYHINTHLNGKTDTTLDDFPILQKTGAKFAMWEGHDGWYIQTLIGEFDEFKLLADEGVRHIKRGHVMFYKY